MTPRELADGLAYWCRPRRRPWPKDLHNAEYSRWADERPFSGDWWSKRMLPRLNAWKAIRPVPGRLITRNYQVHLPVIMDVWHALCHTAEGRDVSSVRWQEVQALPDAVAVLKPTRSSVFRSKFSHFLFPAVFPVVDNWAMGGARSAYADHFKHVQDLWCDAPQEELKALLLEHFNRIGAEVHERFPVVNKIVELCLIGQRHPRV